MVKVFDEWRIERYEDVVKLSYSGETLIEENLNEMSDEQLDFALARFVAEVRKETDKSIEERLYMK